MTSAALYVGIAVDKAEPEVPVRPNDDGWRVANDPAGVAALVVQVRALAPTLIVLEAGGGDERPPGAAWAAAGLPAAVVNPRQARDFARATGKLAETDRLDARALAHFAVLVATHRNPASARSTGGCAPRASRRRSS